MIIALILAALLLAVPAAAQTWTIRTQGPVTITGEGPLPTLVTPPPVVVPPVTPPVAPPVVSPPPFPPPPSPPPPTTIVVPPPPPPPPVAEDTSPFFWPAQPPDNENPAARYVSLGQMFYAGPSAYRNPLPASNWYAGMIAGGIAGVKDVTGFRLWAPRDADPATIRRALRTGRLSP